MSRQVKGIVALTVVVLSIALLLIPLPAGWKYPWVDKVFDLGHLPLFAVLSFSIARATGHRAIALVLCAVLAIATEVLQGLVGRSTDLADGVRSVLGTLIGLLGTPRRDPARPWWERHPAPVAFLLLAWPILDAIPVLSDSLDAWRRFPILCDFSTRWQTERWRYGETQARLERTHDPVQPGEWLGRLDLLALGHPYPGAQFLPSMDDWRGYRTLCLEFHVDKPMTLNLSIRDHRVEMEFFDRVNFAKRYSPGWHRECLDLATLASQPRHAPLDLGWVRVLTLYIGGAEAPRTMLIKKISLE